jgi:pimeloyl-ACP methyl ester carboxylesterase
MSAEYATAERLLDVESADGLVLPGAHVRPAGVAAGTCVVWFPGFGMSYDYPPTLDIARRLATGGIAFVSAVVRGHHGAVTAWQRRGERWGTKRIGSWYEVIEESALDIAAWLGAARDLGYGRVVLAGHSFGAVKSLHCLATGGATPDGLVLASPSLGITTLRDDVVELATRMVERGDGELLLPDGSWPRGFGTRTVSAQTYASWSRSVDLVYGPGQAWRADVTMPVLAYYGDDGDVGGTSELDRLTADMAAVTRRILPGVGHNYQRGTETIAAAIGTWLATNEREDA